VSPRDPRFIALKSRAAEWDRNLYWIEEPDEIDLEIIPPTSSAELPSASVAPAKPERSIQCRALAYLAGELLSALRMA
jgi:hypothetical protein